jgi:hypothetical protein
MFGGNFLEAREMLAGGIGIAFALIGAGNAEFRGSVIGKSGEGFLKFGDGLVVALELGIEIAEEIVGVGFRGKFGDVLKGVDALFWLAGVFVNEAEVVPDVGIIGEEAGGLLERFAGWFELLLAEVGDAEI